MERTRRVRSNRGYAMVLAIMIAMIMSMLSMALVSTGNAELQGARLLSGRTEARDLSMSGLEEFFANVQTVPGFLDGLQNTPSSVSHPAFTLASARGTAGEKWAKFDGVTPVACTNAAGTADLESPCFTISARYETGAGVGQGRSVLLDVTTRVRCGGVAQRCVYARYQQRMRQAQFYDYMFFFKYATLDPSLYPAADQAAAVAECADKPAATRGAGCVTIAYAGKTSTDSGGISRLTSQDIISGPVYTADDWITVCGNPVFTSTVSVAGPGSGGNAWKATTGCPPTASGLIPAERQRVMSQSLGMPPTATVASGAATLADPAYVFYGDVAITLVTTGSATTINVTGGTDGDKTGLAMPDPPLIVVQGNADVSGTLAGRLSIVAADSIGITGNLVYAGGGTTANTRDALGLTAGGSIVITQDATPVDRTVHAALLSLDSTIYTLGWDSPRFVPNATDPSIPDSWTDGNSDTAWVERIFPGFTSDCTPAPIPIYGDPDFPDVVTDFTYPDFRECWTANSKPVGTPPKLTFFGAMASKYQGVFSGLNSATGDIVSGFSKSFTYDSRMTDARIAPPYIVAPTASSWQRLEMVEVPVDTI